MIDLAEAIARQRAKVEAHFGGRLVIGKMSADMGDDLVLTGAAFTPDGRTLYVSETETSRVWAYDVLAPGQLSKQGFPSPNGGRLVCGLPGFQRFDSLAIDALGNICVATLMTGHITVIAPDGHVVRQVKLPDVYPTNICFGGPDLRTAFITLSGVGQVAAARWPEPGLRLNYNA